MAALHNSLSPFGDQKTLIFAPNLHAGHLGFAAVKVAFKALGLKYWTGY